MAVLTDESPRGGAHDRLGALRSTPPAEPRRIRIEVLIGVLLVAAGIVAVLVLRGGGEVPVVEPGMQTPVESTMPSSAGSTVLLEDDALVALALEAGEFPPDLSPGDSVMVTVLPDGDLGAEPRSLESEPTVVSVDRPTDGDTRWIIVVRAKKSLPRALISSRDVVLSIVSGGGR